MNATEAKSPFSMWFSGSSRRWFGRAPSGAPRRRGKKERENGSGGFCGVGKFLFGKCASGKEDGLRGGFRMGDGSEMVILVRGGGDPKKSFVNRKTERTNVFVAMLPYLVFVFTCLRVWH